MRNFVHSLFVMVLAVISGGASASTITVEEDQDAYLQMTIQRANETNAPELMHEVGMVYFHRRDRESLEIAKEWLKRAADQDFPPSQHHLGVLLVSGQDDSYATPTVESHLLIQKAANAGYALSQNYMGGAYRDGGMVEQDYDKAAEWYQLAAQQGNMYGLYNLGTFYEEGIGVEKDLAAATFLYMHAAEEGLTEAEFDLAMLLRYAEENILEGQLTVAAEIFQALAEEGHNEAQFQYGYALAHGAGVSKNEEEAILWYRKAAEEQSPGAMNNLSVMYSMGRGVEKDQTEAFNWAERAARVGHIDAQAKVAIFTMAGNGTKQDMDLGLAWMLMIDRRGHEMTHQYLMDSFGEQYREKLAHLQKASDLLYREFGAPHE